MNEILLLKLGELVLKGLNRKLFENVLLKRIQYTLCDLGKFDIKLAQSTITIVPQEETVDLEEAAERVSKIFGIAAFSRACVTEKNMDAIKQASAEYLGEELEAARTFKVEAKRSDKKFPFNSPQICAQVGEYLLEAYPHLTVDVHNPDSIIYVEVRDYGAYIRGRALQGAGGIPVGTGGKAAVLISGGIDSPVASWMMAKRGVELTAIHFASPPYTSERAEDKVVLLVNPSECIQRQNENVYCTIYKSTRIDTGQLPGGIVYNYYAPFYDACCRTNCKKRRMWCIDYRREFRAGSKPNHAGNWLYRYGCHYACVPPINRYG